MMEDRSETRREFFESMVRNSLLLGLTGLAAVLCTRAYSHPSHPTSEQCRACWIYSQCPIRPQEDDRE